MHLLELLKGQKQDLNFENTIFINQNDSFVNLLEKEKIKYLYFKKKEGYIKHLQNLSKWVSSNKIDLIHSHGYDANYITYLITKFLGTHIPIVMSCHGWVRTSFSLKLKTALDIYTYRIANALTVDGHNMLVIQEKYPKVPVQYIPNGVFPPAVSNYIDINEMFKLKPNTKIIACVGRLSSEKRLDIFLKCCREILQNYKEELAFFIVGSGPEKEKLKELSKTLGLENKIIFTGLILDRNLLANLYNQIEFLILSSDTEGTPRVVVEAMSCGKPIVATNVGGLKELVTPNKNGYLVEKGNYLKLAECSLDLLNNKDKKLLFGQESSNIYNNHFTLEIQRTSINQLYEKILTGKNEETI